MFKKIIVPVDGSASSLQALACAADLGRKYESELIILHVLFLADTTAMELSAAGKSLLETAEDELKNSAQALLAKAQIKIAGYPHKVIVKAEVGNTSEVILEMANKEQCDAIVLGTRGASKLSEVIIGSTTYHVVQHAKVAVVTVRA